MKGQQAKSHVEKDRSGVFLIMFFNTKYWMCFFPFLCSFSEHHRYKENTVRVELQTCERVQKDKHPARLAPQKKKKKKGEHQLSAAAKGDHSPGLMCVQAQQGSKGFWVTWRRGVPKWTGLDWACSRGDWHGSDQLSVNSSCPSGLIAERSLCWSAPHSMHGSRYGFPKI